MIKKMIKCLLVVLIPILMLSGCSATSATSAISKTVFQGNIEAGDVDINSKIPGRVIEIKVEEGQKIKKDEIIALIDSKDLVAKKDGLVAQSKAAEAGVNAAKSQYAAVEGQLSAVNAVLTKAKNGARSEDINKAQAAYDIMKKTYDRVATLHDSGAVSQAQLDEIQAKLTVATQDLHMAKTGARTEDIQAASGQVAAVEGTLAAAESNVIASEELFRQALAGICEIDTYLKDSAIKSPLDGIVTMVNSSEGEMVSTGMNIGTVTDISDIWIEIDVDEMNIIKFKEEQEVAIEVAAYNDKEFVGTVVRINQNPDFAIKKASNENGDFDLITYGVKVKIDNSEELFRPGMTAFVKIDE
jgi:HlyD family secretion protein